MQKIFVHLFIIFSILFVFVPRAEAIKIGLQSDISEVTTGISVKGTVSDKNTGKVICSLDPMKSYIIKPRKDGLEIKIDGKFYNLGSHSVTIEPLSGGFVCAKNR